MTNMEKMAQFLSDVQGMFMENGWSYQAPKVSSALDENDEPCDRLIDAHFKTPKYELLLSLEDGEFKFYGDDYGDRKFKKSGTGPQDVAFALHLLGKERGAS